MGNMFKRASNKKAKFAVIIGEDELKSNTVVLKDLETQEQKTVKYDELVEEMDEAFGNECDCGCHHDHEHDEHCCCHHEEEEK